MSTKEQTYGLERQGVLYPGAVHYNLSVPALYEHALRRGEGIVAQEGPFVVNTGQYTGRSPNDKFIVDEPSSTELVWWGDVNVAMSEETFGALRRRILAYLQGRELFVQDLFVGADARYRVALRVITENAWHAMFARSLFITPSEEELRSHEPTLTVVHAPNFQTEPEIDGTRSDACIALNFGSREVFIAGTKYAGEIKKSVFSFMNYVLPGRGVLPMHCSANVGEGGDVAIFFGLSGTGKTTLSTTHDRALVGDDEHGWSDEGVFNFEGGCYAKVIRLSEKAEPEIYGTTRRFGTVLENVIIDPETRRLDLDDDSRTENTRGAYPITFMSNVAPSGEAGCPANVIMLTADAFGVLPPLSKLSVDQAVYYFLSGYTAKVAGTERGIIEPQATFSPCFGAPFMAQDPVVYADMLREKIIKHGASVWLVNTGWTGGPYGVGSRLDIDNTRAMLRAILNGGLDSVECVADPMFGLETPTTCPDVPSDVLNPRSTWADKGAYDEQARRLVRMFAENFESFAPRVPESVRAVGPSVQG